MDNLECEVIDEKFHEGTLWHDILSIYPDGEDALLLNISEYALQTIRKTEYREFRNEKLTFVIVILNNKKTQPHHHGEAVFFNQIDSFACLL